jgi:protein-L-isoaspartate(D-aspartate) O-methyltransferase
MTAPAALETDAKSAREAMIARQLRTTRVTDERVVAAIRATPRELFVPASRQAVAYVDEDIEVAPGRYLMEPMVFGRLLVQARIGPGDSVLDVGCGTGYSTAVIAQLAGTVVAVETDAALAAKASGLLADLHIANAKVVQAALSAGAPADGPYDVIFLGGVVEEVPQALLNQLAPDGRVVGVIADKGVGRGFTGRVTAGSFGINAFMDAMVAPLPGFQKAKTFSF